MSRCIPIYDHFCYLDPLKMFEFHSYILRIPSVAWSWQYPEFTKPPQKCSIWCHRCDQGMQPRNISVYISWCLDGDGSTAVGGAVALPPVESATIVSDVVSGGFKSSKCCTVSKRRVASSSIQCLRMEIDIIVCTEPIAKGADALQRKIDKICVWLEHGIQNGTQRSPVLYRNPVWGDPNWLFLSNS